jgi:DNA invertase Pin-like site-specific DNA recombinase
MLGNYIGYTRVSTLKQGTKGVSLTEQRDAILRYADRNQLPISLWLEEKESAAKQGRPIFTKALKLLRTGEARGIILHKLDRGARNLRDWVAIGELSDQGAEIHFVNESLDLQSRGGRLSADIQAVVAADYIRNLREETRKGFYGRLKQGLYPLRAPLGYADQGKAKAKTIHPLKGPLVRKAFELYGTGRFNLETLGEELNRLGLRNRSGGRVTRNGLSTLLNNPFYVGIVRISQTNETFAGIHEPLISKSLFDRVQNVLSGKVFARIQSHSFLFRRMLSCATCNYSLIGERQKGTVYYRCHSKECRGTSIKEEAISAQVARFLGMLQFSDEEQKYLHAKIVELRRDWVTQKEDRIRNFRLQLDRLKERLTRLTDVYLDREIEKSVFDERRAQLVSEQKKVEEDLSNIDRSGDSLEKILELASRASLTHRLAEPDEKREILKIVTSNRKVCGKKLELEPSFPFGEIANRFKNAHCDPYRDIPRTWDPILESLTQLNTLGQLPDLSSLLVSQSKNTRGEISLKE